MTDGPIHSAISDAGRQYLRLHVTSDVGPIRLRNLIEHFGSIESVFSASQAELQHVDGVGPMVARSIFAARDDTLAEEQIARATACGLRILCAADDEYPRGLVHISDPPTCLYVKGELQPADAVALAVVGTRRCSRYGREQARRFGSLLGRAGFTVVSGLARGIDAEAHRGALEAGGRTIAVLGNGLSSVYPPEHAELADEIIRSGALVSELPIDSGPEAKNFPSRNRIIVGMALGVIVVEAGKRSGALITSRLASEYNREVFALPGRVDQPDSTLGSNGLIRDAKAKLITCLEDVLDELQEVGEVMGRPAAEVESGEQPVGQPSLVPASHLGASETAVLEAIKNGEEDPDGISRASGVDVPGVAASLTSLQLKGLVRQLPGNRFVRRESSRSAG